MLRHPAALVWMLILTAPFNDHLGLRAGGINLRPYGLLAGMGMLYLLLLTLGRRRQILGDRARRLLPLFLPLAALILSKLTTVVLLHDLPAGMGKLFPAKYAVFAGMLFATAFVTATFLDREERLLAVLRWWTHLANLILVIALVQILLSNAFGFHFVHHRDVIWFGRPYSVFREPDVLGSFFGATVLMVLPLLVYRRHLLSKQYLQGTLAAHSAMLLILFVRAAWVAVVAGLLIWIISAARTGRLQPLLRLLHRGLLAAVIGLLVLPILAPSFAAKLTGRLASLTQPKEEGASEYRMRELEAMVGKTLPRDASPASLRTFLFGHGDFAWSYWAPRLLGENYDRAAVERMEKGGEILIHAGFCMALTLFFDNGAVGWLLMLLFLLLLFRRFSEAIRRAADREETALLYCTFLPVACILICFQFSFDPITPFWWVMIGIFLAASWPHEAAGAGLEQRESRRDP
jgi:hypothetical protein